MLTEKINSFFGELGAEWVLWLLLALSLLSVAVMIERVIFFVRNSVDLEAVSQQLLRAMRRGGEPQARKLVKRLPGMSGGVLKATLEAYREGVTQVQEVISAAIMRERNRYDRFLGILGTLGNNAPFIGLFGTVIGIINAFSQLAGALEGTARTEAVMSSIAEALVATAVGLAVAIPAVIAFNAFKTNIKRVSTNTEWLARNVIAHLTAVNGEMAAQPDGDEAKSEEKAESEPKSEGE